MRPGTAPRHAGRHRAAPVTYDGTLLAGVPRCRTVPPRQPRVPWQVPVIAALCVSLFALLGMQAASAQVTGPGSAPAVAHVTLTLDAATTAAPEYPGALGWAETQAGCWYMWGGSGPCQAGYDCSGLVMRAYEQIGVRLPHNTVAMLDSGMLRRVWHPRPGELAFFGSGHVELYAGGNWTYGAQASGTQVGPHQWSEWWHPTAFYYVWGS